MKSVALCSKPNTTQTICQKLPLMLLFVIPVIMVASIVPSSSCAETYNDCMDIAADHLGTCTNSAVDNMKDNIANCTAFYQTTIDNGGDVIAAKQELSTCALNSTGAGNENIGNCQTTFKKASDECERRLNACEGA